MSAPIGGRCQVHYFTGGGFVVRHLGGFGGKSYSCWYDARGLMVDAEGSSWIRGGRRRSYPVPRGGPLWCQLARMAGRFVPDSGGIGAPSLASLQVRPCVS